MRKDMPEEIRSLIGRCEIGETNFHNDDMSCALKYAEESHEQIRKLEKRCRRLEIVVDVDKLAREEAQNALEAFEEFSPGEEDLWSLLKQQRDEALATVQQLQAELSAARRIK